MIVDEFLRTYAISALPRPEMSMSCSIHSHNRFDGLHRIICDSIHLDRKGTDEDGQFVEIGIVVHPHSIGSLQPFLGERRTR